MTVSEGKSFLASLFDLSFSSFVTPKFIKFIFIVAIILAGLVLLWWIVMGFMMHIAAGVVILVLSPIIYGIMILFARLYLESIMVLFRIQGDLTRLLETKK